MMYVRDKRKWLRTKRWFTAILAFTTLASVGGLEGDSPVPAYSWWLLLPLGFMIWNITKEH
jgi:hypothetical protein